MADNEKHLPELATLTGLAPEERATVNRALKEELTRQLARTTAPSTGDHVAAHTRESGPLHGSEHTRSGAQAIDHDLLTRVHGMDERQFTEFSNRLAALRSKTGG